MKKTRNFLVVLITLVVGELLAACSGAAAINSYPGMTASQNVVYLGDSSGVFAVKLTDGSMLWRFPSQTDSAKSFFAPPALVGDQQVILGDYNKSPNTPSNLYAVKASDGSQIWTFNPSIAGYFVGGPLVVQNTILAPSSNHYLYALNMDGKLLWSKKTGNILWATPVSDGKLVFLPGMDHILYALKLSDGSVVWQKDLGAALQGSPVLSQDGTLYVVTFDSSVYALDSNGNGLWQVPAVGGQVWSSPVLNNNVLYFGSSNNKVFAISTDAKASNRLLWSLDLGDPVIGGVAIAKDGLLVPTENGSAYGVSFNGAKTSIKLTVNGKLYTTPVVTSDLMVLAITSPSDGKSMIAFDKNGKEKWSFTLPK